MSLEIRTRDNAITGWSRVDPQDDASPVAAVAQITWWLYPDRWHINFLRAEQPRHLLPMLAAFRSHWNASGRPIITFRTTDDNRQMQRLARTLCARRAGSFYTVESLPVIPKTATKDDIMGEPTEASLKSKLKKTSGTTAVANYERDRAAEIAATGGFDKTFDKLLHNGYGQALNGILR